MTLEPLPEELHVRPELEEVAKTFAGITAFALHRVFHGDDKEFEVNTGNELVNRHEPYRLRVHAATKALAEFEEKHRASLNYMERKVVEFLTDVVDSGERYGQRQQLNFAPFYVREVCLYLANLALDNGQFREGLDKVGVEGAYKTGYIAGVYAQHLHEIMPRRGGDEKDEE